MKILQPAVVSVFFFLFSSCLCAQNVEKTPTTSVRPAISAEKILVDGVSNAGKLNGHLYRGSQPNERGVRELKKLGVTTIVDLRGELQKKREWEAQQAEALGMRFVVIPGNGWSPPTDEQIAQFFALMAARPQQTVFIHCWFGTDRTGVFIAAYRLAFQHWTPEQAMAEMYDFHFKGFWHPAMKKYVKTFPARLATSPALGPYRAIGHAATSPVLSCPCFPVPAYHENVTRASFSSPHPSPILPVETSVHRRTEEARYPCRLAATKSLRLSAPVPTAESFALTIL